MQFCDRGPFVSFWSAASTTCSSLILHQGADNRQDTTGFQENIDHVEHANSRVSTKIQCYRVTLQGNHLIQFIFFPHMKFRLTRVSVSELSESLSVFRTYGTGMLMTTSLSSRLSSCSSYSMLTSQPVPLSDGQQFTEDRTRRTHYQSHSCLHRTHTLSNGDRGSHSLQDHIKLATSLNTEKAHVLAPGLHSS